MSEFDDMFRPKEFSGGMSEKAYKEMFDDMDAENTKKERRYYIGVGLTIITVACAIVMIVLATITTKTTTQNTDEISRLKKILSEQQEINNEQSLRLDDLEKKVIFLENTNKEPAIKEE